MTTQHPHPRTLKQQALSASSRSPQRAFRYWLRRAALFSASLLLLFSGILTQLAQPGSFLFPTASAHSAGALGAKPKPNRFDPHSNATSTNHQPTRPTLHVNRPTDAPAPLQRPSNATMPPGLLLLRPDAATSFLGQDGRFEVDVPAGAITAADQAAAPGGKLQLSIRQIVGSSGSSAGGSGLISFGTYLIQVVDGSGVLTNQGLRKPITFNMHLPKEANALDLDRAFVVLNGSLPVHVSGAPTSLIVPDSRSGNNDVPGLGKYSSQATTYDPKQQALVTTYSLSTPSTSMSWNTNSPVAVFGHPDPFNVDLSGGSLSASIPLDVPAGPGGLTPPVALTYGSAGVAEQHSIQGAAGWVGEGWNLSFGSISWAEHNSNATCTSGCGNGWEDTWQLSDPFGTAVELIPPNINVKTYFDDTANAITTSPIRWHSTPENYAKVYSYTSSLTLPDGGGVHPPCFRVFLANGIMEEFGCTADSLEYYYANSSGTIQDYISSWNLDLITDPQGNQIHITYQQDIAGSTHHYVRDAVPATVEWDSPACDNAQSMCTGSNWAPLMRVQFQATYAVDSNHLLAPQQGTCNTSWHLRCDDALDLTPSGGIGAPLVQSTLALQDALVQVRTTGTGSWNTLKDYQFIYNQSGPITTNDPATGKQISASGYFLLERLKVFGLNNTSLPTSSFEYTTLDQYYEDSNYHPNPSTNCGPSWNSGTGSGCLLWSTTMPNNKYYLRTFDNGMGLHEVFYYQLARNNTHGVPSGGDPSNPFWCNGYQTRSPCQEVDDQNWSRVVLTKTESTVKRSASTGTVDVLSRTIYSYALTYPLAAQECSDCVAGMYWGNQNDGDYLDYYNGKFMGFTEADVSNPDGSVVAHHYYATEGYGLYDTSVPCLSFTPPCHAAPWWHVGNAAHGHETETDYYDTNGSTLLKKVTNQYQTVCPPSGISGSPAWSTTLNGSPYTYTWDGKLVAALDHGNPVAVCDVQNTRTDDYVYNGSGQSTDKTTTYSYDSYGRQTQLTVHSSDGGSTNGNGGSTGNPIDIVTHTDYVWNDAVTANSTSATGTYLIDLQAQTYNTDPNNTTRTACARYQYDGAGYVTGQQSAITLGEQTSKNSAVDCGSASNSWTPAGVMRTTTTYDTYGNAIATTDPMGISGDTAHLGCTINGSSYTDCKSYDNTYHIQVISDTNSLGQVTSIGYAQDASGGFGLWPTSTTDANGNTTTYTYDGLGRMTSETLPGETTAPTASWTYTIWCAATGAQIPCMEIDQKQRLDSSNTVTSRAFYDGYGNLVETRTPAAGSQDVIRYRDYDESHRAVFDSISYLLSPSYTGGPGAAAFATPDANQPGTTTTYDGIGRATSVADPNSFITTTNYVMECGLADDWGCYEQTNVIDANGHQQATLTDAMGRKLYALSYTGNSPSTYAIYTVTRYVYDLAGNLVKVTQPNGSATTFSYDDAGRRLGMTDPDLGTESYTYDADSNLIQSTDARGVSAYAGYDALNRQLWRNTTNSPTGAYVTYAYDQSGHGFGIGHVTTESFTGGATSQPLHGSYSYTYDNRGQTTSLTLTTTENATYPLTYTYNDAGQPTSLTYSDGEKFSYVYDNASGWLTNAVTTPKNGSQVNLLTGAAYSGTGGAAGHMTAATMANGAYSLAISYDNDLRLSSLTLTIVATTALAFYTTRGYDAVGNVTSDRTALTTGSDAQAFCYDDLNRLTWASAAPGATSPCGTTVGFGTLNNYTAAYSYDTLDRLTSGPLGSYSYGDSAHLHAATQAGSGAGAYTASYDAAGDMICRAPTGSTTCAGASPTGAAMTYDAERRLSTWQDTPTNPTSQAWFMYDGEGHRVEQYTSGGSGSSGHTYYLPGNIEEVTPSGSLIKYYSAGGLTLGENTAIDASGISYLASDGLGSVTEALDGSGNATGAQLYDPYGRARYSSGVMPTAKGFTGQYADATTGLDYYGARYYDPQLAQFTSADPAGDGLNLYAYVHANPETLTDPSGLITGGICGGGSMGGLGGMFGVTVDVCVVVGWSDDDGWSIGLTETEGVGLATPGGGPGIGLQLSNAHSVKDLSGPFIYGGGGTTVEIPTDPPVPVGISGTGFGGQDSQGRTVVGGEVQVGPPTDLPGGWVGVSNTWSQSIDQDTATQWLRDRYYDFWLWLQDENPTPIPIPRPSFGGGSQVTNGGNEPAVLIMVQPESEHLAQSQHDHTHTINHSASLRNFTSTLGSQALAGLQMQPIFQGISR